MKAGRPQTAAQTPFGMATATAPKSPKAYSPGKMNKALHWEMRSTADGRSEAQDGTQTAPGPVPGPACSAAVTAATGRPAPSLPLPCTELTVSIRKHQEPEDKRPRDTRIPGSLPRCTTPSVSKPRPHQELPPALWCLTLKYEPPAQGLPNS